MSDPNAGIQARIPIEASFIGTLQLEIDPSEEGTYTPGSDRRVFHAGALTFGVAICHEGWRYPETVRWAAQRGAHVVFHPLVHGRPDGRPSLISD